MRLSIAHHTCPGALPSTNISALPNYPGNSLASFPLTAFDLNDNHQISFHSGDNNFGDVYGIFLAITGDGYSQAELRRYADFLRREMLLVPGVKSVAIRSGPNGGTVEENVDAELGTTLP